MLKFVVTAPLLTHVLEFSAPTTEGNAVKINDTVSSNAGIPATTTPSASNTGNAKAADKAVAQAAPAPVQTESVSLSSQGKALAGTSATAANTAVFDSKKVERIKSAIADGQFKVNSDKVADGLLETVRDLLHSRNR
jgi:negative regulator of flagellin synthesis FlgM